MLCDFYLDILFVNLLNINISAFYTLFLFENRVLISFTEVEILYAERCYD